MLCWSEPTSKHAYMLSWFSVVVTLAATIAGVILYMNTGSSLCLVFGVENSVDFISSVIVLWRFFVPHGLTEAVEKKLIHREERASMAISFIMGFLGIGILIAAIDDFLAGADVPAHRQLILGIAFFSIICSGIMAVFKFNYSAHLSSPSLFKDGICSTIGAVLGAALFFNTLILEANEGLWWIDPVVSLLCGIFALFLAAQAIWQAVFVEGLPIFSAHWWAVGDETDAGETGGTDATVKESEIV